jgi:hypothetical protein
MIAEVTIADSSRPEASFALGFYFVAFYSADSITTCQNPLLSHGREDVV